MLLAGWVLFGRVLVGQGLRSARHHSALVELQHQPHRAHLQGPPPGESGPVLALRRPDRLDQLGANHFRSDAQRNLQFGGHVPREGVL